MLAARDILAEDPGMSKRALMTRAKSAIAKEDAGKRMQHAQSLECQGEVFRCVKMVQPAFGPRQSKNYPLNS